MLKELLKFHKDTKLNLVGASGVDSYYKDLFEYINNNNLKDSVSLIKRSDNVEKIYEKTTFCILPSFSEGLPLTTIEAQACGINLFTSTNVTREVNCGGVIFLELSEDPAHWAEEIYNFSKEKVTRELVTILVSFFDKFKI